MVEWPHALESELLSDFRDLSELAKRDASVTVRQGDMDVDRSLQLALGTKASGDGESHWSGERRGSLPKAEDHL